MKRSIGPNTIVFPTPVFVVASYDKKGKPNAMTVAWGGICCSVPPCVAISLREATYSYGNIMERKAFTVNIPSEKYIKEADYLGIKSGASEDKLSFAKLTAVKSEIVLQAMDTAGKDSTIRMVFEGTNPQGVRVVSFKEPTREETDHDYLWRIHKQVPAKGEIVIFNRSHYEDVLVGRVHGFISSPEIRTRYAQINHFERMLAQEGTIILKFFLYIDKEEQKKRLQERLEDPKKYWKFSSSDVAERKLWPKYMKAYEDVLKHTSTDWAPWYVIPANKKWYRNLTVARIIVNALEKLKMKYPKPQKDLDKVVII